jgi:hypothetical protein
MNVLFKENAMKCPARIEATRLMTRRQGVDIDSGPGCQAAGSIELNSTC